MAEDVKTTANKGSNSANRDPEYIAKLTVEVNEELDALEGERKKINDRINKVCRNYKNETGVTRTDLMAGRRLASIEDDGERKEKFTNLKFVFNALSKGTQLDWIDHGDEK